MQNGLKNNIQKLIIYVPGFDILRAFMTLVSACLEKNINDLKINYIIFSNV